MAVTNRRENLLRDAEDLVERFEEEFPNTFLDPLFSMVRQLVQEVRQLEQLYEAEVQS